MAGKCDKCNHELQEGQMMSMGIRDGDIVFYHADGWCHTTPFIQLE